MYDRDAVTALVMLNWDGDPFEIIRRMARKLAYQSRLKVDFQTFCDDAFQSGCEAYLRYSKPGYFPTKSIRYHMLNELYHWVYESSWEGPRTVRAKKTVSVDGNEFRLPAVRIENEMIARLDLEKLIFLADQSDAHRRTRHVRTIGWIAANGANTAGKKQHGLRPGNVRSDTYWSACQSLRKFVQGIEGGLS